MELDKDAFMLLVTQNHLQVEGPSAGYLYTGKQGRDGWELYKTANNPWYLYQARRVWTSGVGGGAINVRIQVPSGCVAKLVSWLQIGPASVGAIPGTSIFDEDAAETLRVGGGAAAANAMYQLPAIGANAATTGHLANSVGLILGPGQYLAAIASASLATETVTVAVVLLLSLNTEPVWTTTGAGAAAGILAASTISVENTMTLVPMP
jgi:hypothetical protein